MSRFERKSLTCLSALSPFCLVIVLASSASDASYGHHFRRGVDAMGITEVVTAPHSPWQNAYVEHVLGSIRRECLDHIVIFNERYLRRGLVSGERLTVSIFPLGLSQNLEAEGKMPANAE
jgi:hypothetical protein